MLPEVRCACGIADGFRTPRVIREAKEAGVGEMMNMITAEEITDFLKIG